MIEQKHIFGDQIVLSNSGRKGVLFLAVIVAGSALYTR